MDWYAAIRPLLFQFNEERMHVLAKQALPWMPAALFAKPIADPVTCMGIQFPNRVGLAAGFDTNGDCLSGLSKLGFGFLELGTATLKPQAGNPSPRLFRLPEQHSMINRMGFANKGIDHLVQQVANRDSSQVIGISIGKNRDTPIEDAVNDYVACFEKAYPVADYIAVNLSSPNTPGLRQLQQREQITAILSQLKEKQIQMGQRVPLVVKVSPDETPETYDNIAEAVLACQIDGVIATNATVDHAAVPSHLQQTGGLSGRLITEKSNQVLAQLAQTLEGKVTLIGLGGVMDASSAETKFLLGADLVQVYTGFIYGGPAWLNRLISAVADLGLHRTSLN